MEAWNFGLVVSQPRVASSLLLSPMEAEFVMKMEVEEQRQVVVVGTSSTGYLV